MTNSDKNISIAEMLGAFEVTPWVGITQPYFKGTCYNLGNTRWICGTKDKEEVRKYLGNHLRFDTDANWQYEAIELIEKNKEYLVSITDTECEIFNEQEKEYFYQLTAGYSKKEAVFEALYQFSLSKRI